MSYLVSVSLPNRSTNKACDRGSINHFWTLKLFVSPVEPTHSLYCEMEKESYVRYKRGCWKRNSTAPHDHVTWMWFGGIPEFLFCVEYLGWSYNIRGSIMCMFRPKGGAWVSLPRKMTSKKQLWKNWRRSDVAMVTNVTEVTVFLFLYTPLAIVQMSYIIV